jgi:CRISPR-associated protein Cas6
MADVTYVDLSFPVRGNTIPRDHSYALYGALSRAVPSIHQADWIGIQAIAARLAGPERPEHLTLEPLGRLQLRVPAAKLSVLIGLTGTRLEIQGHPIELGAPTVQPLVPAATLDSRLVVIRLTNGVPKPFDQAVFDQRFVAEAQRQLLKHEIRGDLELCGRQRLTVGGQRVLGHSVRVLGLSAEDSLKLQIHGIGGKRTMGCGIFRPARIKAKAAKAA